MANCTDMYPFFSCYIGIAWTTQKHQPLILILISLKQHLYGALYQKTEKTTSRHLYWLSMNWYLYKNQIFYSKQHAIQQIGYTILPDFRVTTRTHGLLELDISSIFFSWLAWPLHQSGIHDTYKSLTRLACTRESSLVFRNNIIFSGVFHNSSTPQEHGAKPDATPPPTNAVIATRKSRTSTSRRRVAERGSIQHAAVQDGSVAVASSKNSVCLQCCTTSMSIYSQNLNSSWRKHLMLYQSEGWGWTGNIWIKMFEFSF
jgi:hypothetical protein